MQSRTVHMWGGGIRGTRALHVVSHDVQSHHNDGVHEQSGFYLSSFVMVRPRMLIGGGIKKKYYPS